MSWTIIVLIICCLAAVFAVWKEYKRINRSHLVMRVAASLLAVAALALIILPVHYSKNVATLDDHGAILLTNGFEADSLANYKTTPIFTADKAIERSYPKAKLIRLDELKSDSPAISKVHVFGYGLDAEQLDQLEGLPVAFHASAIPGGITTIGWRQKLKTGEALKVQGKYKNDSPRPVKLVLNGLNTQLDTISISAKSIKDFELNTVPKNAGRAVYHVLTIKGKDTLTKENLPVEIDPVKPLKVLMLSASPDFETRFLKNWLSENGFAVAVRSTISKDKFSSEFVNLSPLKMDHLNTTMLDQFDLVIGDLSVLKPEAAVLKQQVMQKGLGVIVRADSSSKASSWLQNDFPVERSNVRNPPPVSLVIKDKKGKSTPLKIDPNFVRPEPGTQPLVNDIGNHVLVNSALAGEGRLIFTTVNNTFNWMLAGDKDDYSSFWSLLVSKGARKAPVTGNWSVLSSLPGIDKPVQLQLTSASAPGQINADSSAIAPEQNLLIPFEWNATYWPSATGWHSVKQSNGQPEWWYVYGDNEWSSVKAAEKLSATANYEKNYSDQSVTKQIHKKAQIDVPKIYFYLLLLLACGYLWVEGKGLTLPSPLERVL
jgi:hypothetical protein